jgi:hypothetical protein
MAKTSGGVRGGNNSNGQSKVQKALQVHEAQIRNNNYESAFVVNDNGETLLAKMGKQYKVEFSRGELKNMKDAILTHNHPRSLGAKGIRAIGNSFSREDIMLAVSANVKEIRAVTPTYTFSVKRPKGGWGASYKTIGGDYERANDAVFREMKSYLNKQNWSESAIARVEVTHFNRVMEKLSKKYGWKYSHKKG